MITKINLQSRAKKYEEKLENIIVGIEEIKNYNNIFLKLYILLIFKVLFTFRSRFQAITYASLYVQFYLYSVDLSILIPKV